MMKKFGKTLLNIFLSPEGYECCLVVYWRWRNYLQVSYEPECQLLQKMINKGDLVIDVGANMGQYSSRMSKLVGPYGRVIAFEALPSTYRLTRKILAAYENIELHNIAVSNREGSVKMALLRGRDMVINRSLSRIVSAPPPNAVQVEEVLCTTLDLFLASRRPVAFIKCDVEDYAYEALSGAMTVIAEDKPVILVEAWDQIYEKVKAMLSPLGYKPMQLSQGGEVEPVGQSTIKSDNYFFVSA
jgi:FkbM family methyltransferase